MPSKDEVVAPEGWNWDKEWEIDLNRAVDDEGKHTSYQSVSGENLTSLPNLIFRMIGFQKSCLLKHPAKLISLYRVTSTVRVFSRRSFCKKSPTLTETSFLKDHRPHTGWSSFYRLDA